MSRDLILLMKIISKDEVAVSISVITKSVSFANQEASVWYVS